MKTKQNQYGVSMEFMFISRWAPQLLSILRIMTTSVESRPGRGAAAFWRERGNKACGATPGRRCKSRQRAASLPPGPLRQP